MAITIRNKQVEADLRQLGSEIGEGPSATIARLVAQEKERMAEVKRLEVVRRRRAMAELIAMLPKFTEEEKAEINRQMEDLYDEDGLPR